jgi:hypothetical protein
VRQLKDGYAGKSYRFSVTENPDIWFTPPGTAGQRLRQGSARSNLK